MIIKLLKTKVGTQSDIKTHICFFLHTHGVQEESLVRHKSSSVYKAVMLCLAFLFWWQRIAYFPIKRSLHDENISTKHTYKYKIL